jgi:tetratricopeptide (TPR) repeat protein
LKNLKNKRKTKTPAKKENTAAPIWFYVILVLIPVIFLVFLELGLRISNYGYDFTQWIKATDTEYVLNPDFTHRYFFTTKNVPYSNGNIFDIEKKSNAFRVFILGGSSAAGYPFTPNGDFGRYLKKYLEAVYPQNKIEVVNLAITAVNSYTIRDLVPGVLEQKPDLIIIYAGHNEYYGALGVGSMESLGTDRFIVNLVLKLNEFKITQLVRNFLKWGSGLFSSPHKTSGTLMSRMAKDQLIKLDSDVYEKGVEQFRDNMEDILDMTRDAGVPVILSTLTCNLKDQPPFVSVKSKIFPSADNVYKQAEDDLKLRELNRADSLFRFAKDLDALRFRAPEKYSQIINSFGKEYHYPVVNIDSVFEVNSADSITGAGLMTDHLHPTLAGYKLMAKSFFEAMEQRHLVPKGPQVLVIHLDAKVDYEFHFTPLDSTIGRYRIILLKNDWPFTSPKSTEYIRQKLDLKSRMDTLAMRVIESQIPWEQAHRIMADKYLREGNFNLYTEEMLDLIDQFPIIDRYYNPTAEILIERKKYDLAYKILHKKYEYRPDAFSTKWLGIIDLSRKDLGNAVKYLNKSVDFTATDPQVLFNLAGAYAMLNKFDEALDTINRCIEIDPEFPGASSLKTQLTAIIKK